MPNTVIKDKFQMEEEVGNLKTERDQLQKRVEELTKEKEMIFRESFMVIISLFE